MKPIKSLLKRIATLIPLSWAERYMTLKVGYPAFSYAPDGEDLILRNMFRGKNNGFYVDVGAHHPTRFSNTRLLYRIGWHGINIDAMPSSMGAFRKERTRDVNLECAISSQPETLTFHVFKEPAYNTFSVKTAAECEKNGHQIIRRIEIKTETLANVFKNNIPEGQSVDLLTIDIEGYDLEALRSNDWSRCKPEVIAVECIGFDTENPVKSEIYNYLKGLGYLLEIATPKNIFFRKKKHA